MAVVEKVEHKEHLCIFISSADGHGGANAANWPAAEQVTGARRECDEIPSTPLFILPSSKTISVRVGLIGSSTSISVSPLGTATDRRSACPNETSTVYAPSSHSDPAKKATRKRGTRRPMAPTNPFLTPGSSSNTISPGWANVLSKENLSPTAADTVTTTTSDGQKLGNVSVTSLVLKDVVFASDQNYQYFLSTLVGGSPTDSWNAAWLGDDNGSALLLLQNPPAVTTSQSLRDVLAALHVDLSSSESKINSFIRSIDATGVLQITIARPPALISEMAPISGLWCVATPESLTIYQRLRLEVALGDVLDQVAKWVSQELGITINQTSFAKLPIHVTVSSTTAYLVENVAAPVSSATTSFEFGMVDLQFFVDLTPSSVTLSITPRKAISFASLFRGAFNAASGAPEDHMPDPTDTSDPVVNFFGKLIYPWYLQVGYNSSDDSGKTLTWDVGILIIMNTHQGPIVFGLAFDSETSTFFGKLLTRSYFLDPRNLRSVTYDARFQTSNILAEVTGIPDIIDTQAGVDLWTLVAPNSSPPSYIPHWLTECNVTLTRTVSDAIKSSTFQFAATLSAVGDEKKPTGDGTDGLVPTGFAWTGASIRTTIQSVTGQPTAYAVTIGSTFTLTPPAAGSEPPASLWATLTYDSSQASPSWLVTADAQDISVGLLASFFDHGSRSGAMAVLDKLVLKTLNVMLAHTSGQASSFWIYGVLALGELELDLSYQYVSKTVGPNDHTAYQAVTSGHSGSADDGAGNPKPQNVPNEILKGGLNENTYIFEAYLRTTSVTSTLGSIVDSIVPASSSSLPEFVSGIRIDPKGTGNVSTPTLTFGRSSTGGSILCIFVDIAGFSFTFVQFKTVASSDGKTAASTKRILRFECDKIPLIDKVPVINELPQPFDSLEFLSVADDQTVAEKKGITKADLASFPSSAPVIQYKQAKQQEKDEDIVLAVGHHFMVVANGKVVLDHVFGSAAAAPAASSANRPASDLMLVGPHATVRPAVSEPKLLAAEDVDDSTEAKPTKGAAVLQVGPLSVTAISLQVVSGHLLVSLDATLSFGGMTMSVIGFTIGIDLSSVKLNDLKSLTVQSIGQTLEKIHVSLNGLAVGIERGPLTLAGVFEHRDDPTAEVYRGGIAVGFEAWQVLAVGEYKIVHGGNGIDEYRAVFVYGKLDGPLVSLEFATISGVRLGFGYNYTVRMPSINELYQFPFISDAALSGAGNDPMAVLNAMTAGTQPFVYAKQNSIWFCAGMTITACDMLTMTAVLLFDISTASSGSDQAGVVMALLADGIIQMEPLAPPDLSLFYVEIVMKIELNFIQGYIAVDAALAPTSHVYVPQARLTGQASFYSWFGSNPHAGDWVASIGGYARNYTPAPHYPVPERLGLSFCVGDNIQLIGTGYMAVTPKCAMAGGSLHLSLSVGPVSAYADVMLDAFINFKPFHFHAYIGLSVGVECDIDILFIHIHISIHLGADLILWGPHDFGGWAHVDFWFFGFDISFGADENAAAKLPIDLVDFLALVRTPGPNSEARSTDGVSSSPENADVAIHKWTVEQGLLPAKTKDAPQGSTFPSTGANTEWFVDAATVVMRVDTVFALTSVQFATSTSGSVIPIGTIDPTKTGRIFVMPMHSLVAATSVLTITVMKGDVVQTNWRAELVPKSGAPALWSHAPWTSDNDPLSVLDGAPPPPTLRNGSTNATVDVILGVRLLAPEPVRARSQVVQFDIAAARLDELVATKHVVVEEDDRAFDAVLFEPAETNMVKQWKDFGTTMVRGQNTAGQQLDLVRAAMTLAVADCLEWAIQPVAAGSADLDANGGWVLKGVSAKGLANDIATQWGELPFISVGA